MFDVCFGWLNRRGEGGEWVIRCNFGLILSVIGLSFGVIGLNFDKGEWVIRCNRCNSLYNLSVIRDFSNEIRSF